MAEAAIAAPPVAPVAKLRPQVLPKEVEFVQDVNFPTRVIWAAEGVTQEHLRYVEYWKFLAQRNQVKWGDRIEVRAYDRSWRVELTVIGVNPNGLDVHFDKVSSFKTSSEPDDDDGSYTIRMTGGSHPWAIIRNKDGREVGREPTRDAARVARRRLYPNF